MMGWVAGVRSAVGLVRPGKALLDTGGGGDFVEAPGEKLRLLRSLLRPPMDPS